MSGERGGRGKTIPGHEYAAKTLSSTRRQVHWALVPFLAGVLIGLAISTAAVVRPHTDYITNVYINLGKSMPSLHGVSVREPHITGRHNLDCLYPVPTM